MRTSIDDPAMGQFVARLAEINALADEAPGFVWRLQTDAGDATEVRAYDDDHVLFNLSVWRSVEELRSYVYRSAHNEVMRRRASWFAPMAEAYSALWWVAVGHIPTIEEAKERLELLRAEGPGPSAFTFRHVFQPQGRRRSRIRSATRSRRRGARPGGRLPPAAPRP
jgi:hypothetical protein